jgi:Tol biopolymer transport system component
MDVATRKQRLLLAGADANRYNYIYWNLGWSHDSRWIAFKGQPRDANEFELAVAGIGAGDGLRVLFKTSGSLHADFTWAPDNRRVLFAMHSPQHQGSKLFLVDRLNPTAPALFLGHAGDQEVLGAAWSRDGRRIAFAGQTDPQPMDWLSGATR